MTAGPRLLDLVAEQHPTLFPRRVKSDGTVVNTSKVAQGRTVVRKMAEVTSICFHQTACVFGPLDEPEKRWRRALKIPAHVTAFRDGVYVQAAPLSWFLYHGNGVNPFSLGLEMEGQYPGLLDNPATPAREDEQTFWSAGAKKPTPLDALALATFRAATAYLVEEGRRQGAPIRYAVAHRQANREKPSDPGQELWQRVVVDYACRELGLETRRDEVWGGGKKIPTAWDSRASARY